MIHQRHGDRQMDRQTVG